MESIDFIFFYLLQAAIVTERRKQKFSWSYQVGWQALAPPWALEICACFTQSCTPNILGDLVKQNHYRSLWQPESHRCKAKRYLLGKTLVHSVAAGALCTGRVGCVWAETGPGSGADEIISSTPSAHGSPQLNNKKSDDCLSEKQNITFLTSSTARHTREIQNKSTSILMQFYL